jgi:hypothetical protein
MANTHFGPAHHKNTPANAFRHAAWNWLIARNCAKSVKDEDKVLAWTEKITEMHEKILPGNYLSDTMDLHNNLVGRVFFQSTKQANLNDGLAQLLILTERSVKVSTVEQIRLMPQTQLVHISDPEA